MWRLRAQHARLPRARRDEHGARRPVRQPHQHEPARRTRGSPTARARRSTSGACPGPFSLQVSVADGGDGAGDRGVAARARRIRGAAAGHRRGTAARRRRADARLRAELRDGRPDWPRRRRSSRCTTCPTTTSRSSCRAIERVTPAEVTRVAAALPRSRPPDDARRRRSGRVRPQTRTRLGLGEPGSCAPPTRSDPRIGFRSRRCGR